MVHVINLVSSSSPNSSFKRFKPTNLTSFTSPLPDITNEKHENSVINISTSSINYYQASTLNQSFTSIPRYDHIHNHIFHDEVNTDAEEEDFKSKVDDDIDLDAYEKFKREWQSRTEGNDSFGTILNSPANLRKRISDNNIDNIGDNNIDKIDNNNIDNNTLKLLLPQSFKNKAEAINSIRLHMSSSMAEAYESELRRRFTEKQMEACVSFDISSVLIPTEMASFRWKYSGQESFLEPRLFVLDSELLWDEFISNRKYSELLQAYNEPNVFLYFINWKRAAQRHNTLLNRQFKQSINTSGEIVRMVMVPANELENEFFLEAAQLRLQVNFSPAGNTPQSLVDLIDFIIQMTRVVALKGHLTAKNTSTVNPNLNLTVDRDIKIKCGKDARDCWIRMLSEIPRVTWPIAEVILARYPSFYSLMEAYDACEKDEGEMLLAELRMDGEGKRIGPVTSKRIYSHFQQ